jgi:hypothetical protein
VDSYKVWADETWIEFNKKPKIDQDRMNDMVEEIIEEMNGNNELYEEGDNEDVMQEKDEITIRRRAQRIGVMRYCYEQLSNDVDTNTREILKEYIKCSEGRDVEPLDLNWEENRKNKKIDTNKYK